MITDSSRRLAEACENLRVAMIALGRPEDDEKMLEARSLIQVQLLFWSSPY